MSALVLCDVTLRDGIQTEKRILPTEVKLQVVQELIAAGVSALQVASFVDPRRVPQFGDSTTLCARLRDDYPAHNFSALVPNVVGARRALSASMFNLDFAITATESYNQRNVGRTIAESLLEARQVIHIVNSAGGCVTGAIGVAFGCPIEGSVDAERVLQIASSLLEYGASGIQLADTGGFAVPHQVERFAKSAFEEMRPDQLSMHFHDTFGRGLLNAFAAVQVGVRRLDATLGGLGGSPVAASVGGNVCLEDLVSTLEASDIKTGVDLKRVAVANRAMSAAVGRDLAGRAD